MKILIVSDSHGITGPLRTVIMRHSPDMLIHLGDSEYSQAEIASWAGAPRTSCIFIRGNCDYNHSEPSIVRNEAVFYLKGHRFFCTHGHRQHVNHGLLTLSLTAQEQDCDICLFGHTHIPCDSYGDAISAFNGYYGSDFETSSGPRILNPGSISIPRGGSKRGYMVMEMEENGRYEVFYHTVD